MTRTREDLQSLVSRSTAANPVLLDNPAFWTLVEKCADAIQLLNEAWCTYEFFTSLSGSPTNSVILMTDDALFTIGLGNDSEPQVKFKGEIWGEVNSSEQLSAFVAEWLQSYRMRRCG